MASCTELLHMGCGQDYAAGAASFRLCEVGSRCKRVWPCWHGWPSFPLQFLSCRTRWRFQWTAAEALNDMHIQDGHSQMMQLHAVEADLASVRNPVPSPSCHGASTPAQLEGQANPQPQTQMNLDCLQEEEKGGLKRTGIFPGGLRRAEVRLPGLALVVTAGDVLDTGANEFLEKIHLAVAAGCTIIVLAASGGSGGELSSGGAKLYQAALVLKATLRGRADLVVIERVDIAAAAGASGVVLSDEGLPAVVARSMMQNANLESPVLPMVARSVKSTQSAISATATEGADLLILHIEGAEEKNEISSVHNHASIPIFVQMPSLRLQSLTSVESLVFSVVEGGVNGLLFDGRDLKEIDKDNVTKLVAVVISAMNKGVQQTLTASSYSSKLNNISKNTMKQRKNVEAPLTSLDFQAERLLVEERTLLKALIKLLRQVSPEMEEVSLLIDAIAQLDEPFLLMIVGEFNSGKSSIINSLLGKKYLKEGVLPTTNEITVLKHTRNGNHAKERSERHPDGHFIHYLSAGFLKQMNLVDTPGTNVILKRQQRLTEEFIPRADLILFVLSADRPFTESETTFLQYIRQWGKKIIFLLNKSDIFSDARELEEVLKFVESNAQRLLSMDQAAVYPVSARKALLAKTEASRGDGDLDVEKLHKTSDWESSGFGKLESFISEFLGVCSDAGAERKRLKLLTPLGIALALLEACEKQLAAEWEKAVLDFEVLNQLFKQLDTCEKAVEDDAFMRSQVIFAQINATKDRAEKFVDVILRLSNINAMARYLLGGDRKGKMPVESGFDEQVMGSVQTDIQTVLEERRSWITDNLKKQASSFRALLINRWPGMTATNNDWHSGDEWGLFTPDNMNKRQSAIDDVLNGFDIQAAKVLLDQEIKEVVVTTFGTLGAASVSASVLTSILPSTLEDLMALGICSAGGFMGVWNLPKRRTEAKRKIQQVVKSFVNQIEAAMQAETREAVEELKEEIGAIIKPYQISVVAEKDRVSSLQRQVQEMVAQVQALRLRVQNLGTL